MTQGFKPIAGTILTDPTTGAPLGLLGADGKEYLLPVLVANGNGPTTPRIDGTTVGATNASVVRTSNFGAVFTDSSGTPGNATNNSPHGRAAFAAAGTTVVITSSLCTANSAVLVSLEGSDATLTSVRVTPSAGSFTVTGNAAATGNTPFSFLLVGV